jgi:hypothetical protein
MKTLLAAVLIALAAAGGYFFGFGHGWHMGLKADAAPRGVISLRHLQMLEKDRIANMKLSMEVDIDRALIGWHELSQSNLMPFVNAASGLDVFPGFEKYIRTLATYRKANASPALTSEYAKLDPTGTEEGRRMIAKVVADHAR